MRPDHRHGYCNTISLLVLTLCYIHNTSDIHVVAREAERLLCSQTDRQRSLTLRRLHRWTESIMLANSQDNLRESLFGFRANNQMSCLQVSCTRESTGPYCAEHKQKLQAIKRTWNLWLTIDGWLCAYAYQVKDHAICNMWIPRHFVNEKCESPAKITTYRDDHFRQNLICIVPKYKPPKDFWTCFQKYLDGCPRSLATATSDATQKHHHYFLRTGQNRIGVRQTDLSNVAQNGTCT